MCAMSEHDSRHNTRGHSLGFAFEIFRNASCHLTRNYGVQEYDLISITCSSDGRHSSAYVNVK